MRRTFAEALAFSGFSVEQEHETLYTLVYGESDDDHCLWELFDRHFIQMPFRGTCINAESFDERHHFDFDEHRYNLDLDYFVSFCEYAYNIAIALSNMIFAGRNIGDFVVQHIESVLEFMNYRAILHDGLYELIEDNGVVSEAAMLSSEASSKVILHYNHHSMDGDLIGKQRALLQIANEIEPHREELKAANATLSKQLFFALNNLNIRHNNIDANDQNHYFAAVARMSESALEGWYDTTYQMCLEAILAVERYSKRNDISELMSSRKR